MSIIRYVEGDLLDNFDKGLYWGISHGCNIFNQMGSGIAKSIRERYPQAYKADLTTIKGDRSKLGTFTWSFMDSGACILNMYTQATFWDPNDMLDYEAVRNCFSRLHASYIIHKDFLIDSQLPDLFGIPIIGAGLARGDWSKIESIINEVTPTLDIECVIFKPNKVI